MSTDLVATSSTLSPVQLQPNLFALAPKEMVARATMIANVLSDVVTQQGLYSMIQGKKYLNVDAWATLGTLLGVMPKERSVIEHPNGDFEAYVDLVSQGTGIVIGGGSALCSVEEKRWGSAEKYARRSMAITRATGKAYRLCFAWIATLAGYESTPEEEMPQERPKVKMARPAPSEPAADKQKGHPFDPKNKVHVEALRQALVKRGVTDEDEQDKAGVKMIGKYMDELDTVLLPFA